MQNKLDEVKRSAWNISLRQEGPPVFVTYRTVLDSIQERTDEQRFQLVDWTLPENIAALRNAEALCHSRS